MGFLKRVDEYDDFRYIQIVGVYLLIYVHMGKKAGFILIADWWGKTRVAT